MSKLKTLQSKLKYWEKETHLLDNYPYKMPSGKKIYPSYFSKQLHSRACERTIFYEKKIEKYWKRHFIKRRKNGI